jgi:transcriptional regulator with XRE-family HTH domain
MSAAKVRELGKFIRDQRRVAQISLRNLADQAGVSNPYLSQIERGLRKPSAEILQGIARALRISAETLYVKAGILEERQDSQDLVAAILREQDITEKHKQVLIEVYRSFRREAEAAAKNRAAREKAVPGKITPPARAGRSPGGARRAPVTERKTDSRGD